ADCALVECAPTDVGSFAVPHATSRTSSVAVMRVFIGLLDRSRAPEQGPYQNDRAVFREITAGIRHAHLDASARSEAAPLLAARYFVGAGDAQNSAGVRVPAMVMTASRLTTNSLTPMWLGTLDQSYVHPMPVNG